MEATTWGLHTITVALPLWTLTPPHTRVSWPRSTRDLAQHSLRSSVLRPLLSPSGLPSPVPREVWQPAGRGQRGARGHRGSTQALFSGSFPLAAKGRKERKLEPGVDPSQLLGAASGAEVGGG